MTLKIDKIFILLLLYFQVSLNAQQVGIGTLNPNPNSALDVVSTDKGILIPRISDTSAVTKIDGALFYHDGEHAFYYCQDNKWQRFASAQSLVDADGDTYLEAFNHAANEDSIVGVFNGNMRVVMKENTNQDFVFETFSDDGNLFIGERAGSQITGDISKSPIQNIGIGTRALKENVFGSNNVALGFESLTNSVGVSGSNVSGDANTAIGSKAYLLIHKVISMWLWEQMQCWTMKMGAEMCPSVMEVFHQTQVA